MEIRRTGSDLLISTETTNPQSAVNQSTVQQQSETQEKELTKETIATRKNDFAMAGVFQQALLGAQLDELKPPSKTAPASEASTAEGAGSVRQDIKFGDRGLKVLEFQEDLNRWLRTNGLPLIPQTAVYDEKTADAVAKYQKASGLIENGKAGGAASDRLKLESDRDFNDLSADMKKMILDDMNFLENDPNARGRLMNLVMDRGFAKLIPQEAQKAAVNAFMSNTASDDHLSYIKFTVLDVAILEREKAFDKLTPSVKEKAISTLFQKADNGRTGREYISNLVKSDSFVSLTPIQQEELLDSIAMSQDPKAPLYMTVILESDGFKNADPEVRDRIVYLAAQNARTFADTGDSLGKMEDLVKSDAFQKAKADMQQTMLNQFRTSTYNEG